MTVLSTKKPVNNNNRDSSSNQQQQPPITTTVPQQIPALTRTRVSRDDEHSTNTNLPLNSNEDSDETNDQLSSSETTTTNNLHSMLTTSPIFSNHSKRKSHSHPHHVHSTITKQARRRCPSDEENLSSNEDNLASASAMTTMNNQSLDETDQYNSEDEHEQRSVKYDRNNLNEVCVLFSKKLFIYFSSFSLKYVLSEH